MRVAGAARGGGAVMALAAALLLLLVVNGAPILARNLLGARWARPLDGGHRLGGRPVLGPSKTWRGLAAAVAAGALAAPVLGLEAATGALFGLCAMAGDALASFVKRRLGVAPSGPAPGLDQGPEALLPLALLRGPLGLDWWEILVGTLVFVALGPVLSQLLYRLRIRRQPW